MVDVMKQSETLARIERGFNPRNVAVIGAARHNEFRWIKAHLPFHQNHGKVFHVNIDENEWPGAEALGVKNFKSLLDIPEPIDYVCISVPRQVVPRLLPDCAQRGSGWTTRSANWPRGMGSSSWGPTAWGCITPPWG
ncbi:MAG: hypothetical protein HW388_376 [Dehalococcoidia bacterium]|nr:hypothetical protein [Dehalococcoidia bacterium]